MAFGYSDRSGTPKPYDATAWTRGVHPDRPLPQAAPVYDAAPTRPAPALAPSAHNRRGAQDRRRVVEAPG